MSGFGYFLSFLTAFAIGLVARAAQLFTVPDVCTRRLKFPCTSLHPSCCVVCMADLGFGQDPDTGSVSCVGPGYGRLLGSVESAGLERMYLAFLQPKTVLLRPGTGYRFCSLHIIGWNRNLMSSPHGDHRS